MGAVEFFTDVFVGLGGVVIPPASGNGESREAQYGHEPQQHYDNLVAHGQGLRCLHCKYNNNVRMSQNEIDIRQALIEKEHTFFDMGFYG